MATQKYSKEALDARLATLCGRQATIDEMQVELGLSRMTVVKWLKRCGWVHVKKWVHEKTENS